MVSDRQGMLLPRQRTAARWWALSRSPHTLLRALQYEALSGAQLPGIVLDVGGDERSGYHRLVRAERIETVNLNPDAHPTHISDLEQPLAFPDHSFDHVISLNTFEHLFNDQLAIGEALRVLRPGGSFHVLVPFCHQVHGSPRDFSRHTAEWWAKTLEKHGISDFFVEPLLWDRRSTGAALARVPRSIRAIVMAMALIDLGDVTWRVRSLFRRTNRLSRSERRAIRDADDASFALGYYIAGHKSPVPARDTQDRDGQG